jgi:sugar lactone lactonase YvrE
MSAYRPTAEKDGEIIMNGELPSGICLADRKMKTLLIAMITGHRAELCIQNLLNTAREFQPVD